MLKPLLDRHQTPDKALANLSFEARAMITTIQLRNNKQTHKHTNTQKTLQGSVCPVYSVPRPVASEYYFYLFLPRLQRPNVPRPADCYRNL